MCSAKRGFERGFCSYHQGFSEGSSFNGWYFDDAVGFEGVMGRSVVAPLGCHQAETKLFYTQKANGLFGMAAGGLLDTFLNDQPLDRRAFALCLAEWGGRLSLGGANFQYHVGRNVTVRSTRLNNEVILHQGVSQMDVSHSRAASISSSVTGFGHRTIIDPGTTYTYLPRFAYRALRDQIERYCMYENCGARRQGTCWLVGVAAVGLKHFPMINVSFHPNGDPVLWEPRSYMYRKGLTNRWCYAFEDDGLNAATTLGASFMVHKDVLFDLDANTVTFSSARCPEYRTRPPQESSTPVMTTTPDPPPFTAAQETMGSFMRRRGSFQAWVRRRAPLQSNVPFPTTTFLFTPSPYNDREARTFVFAPLGFNCPDGARPLINELQCKVAAAKMHKRFYKSYAWAGAPRGCVLTRQSEVHFIEHSASGPARVGRLICERVAWHSATDYNMGSSASRRRSWPHPAQYPSFATTSPSTRPSHDMDSAMGLLDKVLRENGGMIENLTGKVLDGLSKALESQKPRRFRPKSSSTQAESPAGDALEKHNSVSEQHLPSLHGPEDHTPWIIAGVSALIAVACAGLAFGILCSAQLSKWRARELRVSLLECEADGGQDARNNRGHKDEELADVPAVRPSDASARNEGQALIQEGGPEGQGEYAAYLSPRGSP